MAYLAMLFLPCVIGARTHIALPGNGALISKEAHREIRKVFTNTGKECKFPFRQGGRIHHHCITILSSRPWCSLTHNFDRDGQFGFCSPNNTQPDVCRASPCRNGGSCLLLPDVRSFECSCPENVTGRLCEQKKCFETIHQHYYDTGESWGRIHLRNVEQCTCVEGEIECERVRYTICRSNPCQNDGACRLIEASGEEVCSCRRGFSGPDCSFEPEAECYMGRGRGYRGVVGTTASGARCLPWNSDLMYNELHVGTVVASPLRGLGRHAYCRNPDGDKMPWCYTLNDGSISWEFCGVPSCRMPVSSSRRIVPFNHLPAAKKPKPARPNRKSVCGKRHKKRLSIARGRIFGGNSALPGSHPWMVAIYIGQSDFCAGTLVSSCWVVSAAHCFFRNPLKSQIRIVLGQQRLNVTDSNTRTFGVEDFIFPKQFSVFNPTLHDIVLIKLKKRDGRCVKKTPFIRPICLPDKSMAFPDDYCCTISGWGHIHEKADSYSSLQEGVVRLVPLDTCRKPEVYGNHVTANMLCANNEQRCVDACQGDSGGPLACARNDVSFLYGIISWGEGCGRTGKPGVYTKVLNYMDWIHTVIKRKPKAS